MLKKSFFCTILVSHLLTNISILFASGSGGSSSQWKSDDAAARASSSSEFSKRTIRLLSIAQDDTDQRQCQALDELWHPSEAERQNRTAVFPILLEMAQYPGPNQWFAITRLWCGPSVKHPTIYGDEKQNRAAVQPFFLEVAQNPEHPHQWDAIRSLWYALGEQQEQNCNVLRPVVLEAAQNPHHPEQLHAIFTLWNYGGARQEENRTVLHPYFEEAIQNSKDPRYPVLLKLLHTVESGMFNVLGFPPLF